MSTQYGCALGMAGYPPIKRTITKQDEILISKIFRAADENSKGYLSRTDLKVAMAELLGYKPTKYEANQMLDTYGIDVDEIKGMYLEAFIVCMSEKIGVKDEDEGIRHTFMSFDVQCRGFLTVEDVKKVFKLVAPNVQPQTVHSAFREIDQDGDGRVSYKDFEFLMKYNTEGHF